MSKKKRLIVIDCNSVLHRAYHVLPSLRTKKGELVNAIYGFLLVFFKVIRELQPDYVAACFDFPAPTFRHEKFEEYKAKRPPAPEEFYQQVPKTKEILNAFNSPVFEKEGFEADDLIGTISKTAPKKQIIPEIETIILSGDLDNLQLIDSYTKVYLLKKGIKDTVLYDTEKVKEKYGIAPEQILDFKSLKGDPSDNIPGIPGVGEKTALYLIKEFNSLENLYKEIEQKTEKTKKIKDKLKELLCQNKEQVFFNKTLIKIKQDVPLDFNLEKCQWGKYNKEKIIKFFKDFEFFSLINRLSELEKKAEDEKNLKLC